MKKRLAIFVFLITMGSVSFGQVNLSNALELHYPFSSNLDDLSPNGYDGTSSGAILTTGKVCQGISFDGVDDYVTAGNVLDLEYNQPFSIAFWVKALSTSISTNQEMLLGKLEYGGNNRGWGILRRFDYPDKLSLILRNTISTSEIRVSTVNDVFNTSAWKHVIITYDGSASASGLKIYVNGISESFNTESNTLSSTIANTADFTLASRDGQYSFFKGLLDEVRIYSRVLSTDEIEVLSGDEGLVAHYPLSGNADDEGIHSYDGTVVGAGFTTGQVGNAASFDGVDDYVTAGNVLDLEYNQPFSIAFWVKALSTSISTNQEMLLGKLEYGGNNRGWGILRRFDYPDKLSLILRNTISTSEIRVSTVNDIFSDTSAWKHVIITYDGSASASGLNIYVDGISESFNTESNTLSSTIANTADFTLASRDGQHSFFKGLLDEVKIYDRVVCLNEFSILRKGTEPSVFASSNINESSLAIYPNPTTGNFTVNLTMPNDQCHVKIVDHTGKSYYTASWQGKQGDSFIELIESGIETAGVYYMIISSSENIISRKIIIR